MSNIFLKNKKSVRFNSSVEVHVMHVWSFAYQQSRIGQWEMIARDSARFHRRIEATGLKISKVLEIRHRETIYNNRFKNKC